MGTRSGCCVPRRSGTHPFRAPRRLPDAWGAGWCRRWPRHLLTPGMRRCFSGASGRTTPGSGRTVARRTWAAEGRRKSIVSGDVDAIAGLPRRRSGASTRPNTYVTRSACGVRLVARQWGQPRRWHGSLRQHTRGQKIRLGMHTFLGLLTTRTGHVALKVIFEPPLITSKTQKILHWSTDVAAATRAT